jgi:hypothetical protein
MFSAPFTSAALLWSVVIVHSFAFQITDKMSSATGVKRKPAPLGRRLSIPSSVKKARAFTVGENGKKIEQEFCGVSHGSLSSNCTVVMLGVESARNVDQDLSAFEQMGDGFLDFRHRIDRGDGDAQRTGANERSGFDLRRQNLRP